jgi:hypothetical protein
MPRSMKARKPVIWVREAGLVVGWLETKLFGRILLNMEVSPCIPSPGSHSSLAI